MDYVIEGAKAILPDAVEALDLSIKDGHIETFSTGPGRRINGRNLILAPAMVDIHGDAFERQVMPRNGVFFPLEAAILDTDRQLAANGIATAYHALTLSWEPGLRAVERGAELLDALAKYSNRLSVENRVQLRWETFAREAEPLIERALETYPHLPSIAFNDHTSMTMRGLDVSVQERLFEHNPAYALADPQSADFLRLRTGNGGRSKLSPEAYRDRLIEVFERRSDVPDAIKRIAALGQAKGAPMLSHDDTQDETRDFYRELGASIAEFPMRIPVTQKAKEAGDWIVFGAPNAVRGGSHIGSPSAAEMVEMGLADILASDYFYPAMLAAVARMHRENRAPLPQLWATVSANPARASGLSDRGEIALGKRADLVLLDWPEGHTPRVVLTMVTGRIAYMSADLLEMT